MLAISKAVYERFDRILPPHYLRGRVGDQILTWFVEQPDMVRSLVLDEVDSGMEIAYAEALERLAAGLRRRAGASEVPTAIVVEHDETPDDAELVAALRRSRHDTAAGSAG